MCKKLRIGKVNKNNGNSQMFTKCYPDNSLEKTKMKKSFFDMYSTLDWLSYETTQNPQHIDRTKLTEQKNI